MLVRIIDLNCKEKEYKFNISEITDFEWKTFAHTIVMENGERSKDLTIHGVKVVIRDNKAKVKLFYQDSTYHELVYRFDEFGRISKNYKDIVSSVWQNVMERKFGEEYSKAFDKRLEEVNNETKI